MSNPRQYLVWMGVYLAVVGGICLLLHRSLAAAFMANWGFNTLILVALGGGIAINMYQVIRLAPEIRWMQNYRTGEPGVSVVIPRLLSSLSKHLTGLHRNRFSLTALSMRTVLEGIRGRMDESREVSRYMIGLLIFLGLLGTFWGLLGTIAAVSKVVAGLEVSRGDFGAAFGTLKAGLQEPLAGMGTAFSSSLFGLGGSLVLGFLDIQAGHAQNRFFNELEEWLSGVTQLVQAPRPPGDDAGEPATAGFHSDRELRQLALNIRHNTEVVAQLLEAYMPGDIPEKKPK